MKSFHDAAHWRRYSMKYKTIRPGSAQAGDIVVILSSVYDETIKSAKHWQTNFIKKREYIKLTEQPQNNGSATGKDKAGRRRREHLNDKNIIGIYRRVKK